MSCQYSSVSSTLHLRIVESDVLDTASISIAEETGIIRGGIDVEITDGLPVAIECTLILITRVTNRSPAEFFCILGAILRMAELRQVDISNQLGRC